MARRASTREPCGERIDRGLTSKRLVGGIALCALLTAAALPARGEEDAEFERLRTAWAALEDDRDAIAAQIHGVGVAPLKETADSLHAQGIRITV